MYVSVIENVYISYFPLHNCPNKGLVLRARVAVTEVHRTTNYTYMSIVRNLRSSRVHA